VDGDDDGGSGLAFPRLHVWIEVTGGEDANVLGVEDRLCETEEQCVWVFRLEGDREGVDSKLGLVRGEAEGQPRGLAHGEGLVKLRRQRVEIGCESGSRGGRVGDEEGDRTSVVDLGRNCKGEGAVGIPKDTGSHVGESGRDQRSLWVLRWGGTRSVEPAFIRGERPWCLANRHTVAC